VEVVSYFYNAAVLVCFFVCCAEWHMCVLCSLISLFHGRPTSLSSTGKFLENSRSTGR